MAIGVAGMVPPLAYAGGEPPPEKPWEQEPPPEPVAAVDRSFIKELKAATIEYNRPDEAIDAGKVVCSMFRGGYQPDDIVGSLKRHNDDLTSKRAMVFIKLSTHHYCPQFTPEDDEA